MSTAVPRSTTLALLGGKIFFAVIFRFLTFPFRWYRWNGPPVLYKDVVFAAVRTMVSNITIAESRYIYKSTGEVYKELCKETNQTPETLTLKENNVKGHWIGKHDAKVVILFLHGGGYTQSCTIEHMRYLHRLVTDLNNTSDGSSSIAILLLEYTLVPEAQFPIQLKQASTLLSYLLNEGQRAASDIMIAGDSAGGGLVLSLLSHLRHPHLDIQTITLHQPLRGVFLFSPWVSYDTSFDSFAGNAFKDVLVPDMLRKWSGMYLGTVDNEIAPEFVDGGNNYSEPLLANASWWEGMHDVVGDLWLFGGQDEVFIDALRAFGAKFLEGWKAGGGIEGKVEFQFAEGEPHIGPIMDVMLQYKEKAQGQLALERWLKERLA